LDKYYQNIPIKVLIKSRECITLDKFGEPPLSLDNIEKGALWEINAKIITLISACPEANIRQGVWDDTTFPVTYFLPFSGITNLQRSGVPR